MYLDKRSKEILEELISHPNLSSKDIETKTGLSRRQIKYSVEKINNWLKENNYPVLQRLKNGKFLIHPVLGELYDQDQLRVVDNYIPSEDERVLLVLLILLSQHDLSLVHFTQALKVSNVTILSDMKKAQQKIEPLRLQIVYSRTDGYQLTGDEWELRNLLYYLLQDLSRRYGELAMVQDFAMLDGKKTWNFIFP
ncbi:MULTISPECIES: helix-turn-helix domain-containing protein [unclassified Virgibacillus]|uniref:helix-turn-helix domain-containing protein n=1 Tax=Virgibacillus TaxID=84406 RepID=UPI00090C07AD|nr:MULTISPECIES: helix-turn-helix domain-containing protein [unclassified Virgibacillus]API93215.1 hypothetical protein BKP57_16195 [Virgibacillus sp. 6R]MBS7428740.1 helix-turn-helix domain-containing protein [Virgibacillus sp. 19R1-5]